MIFGRLFDVFFCAKIDSFLRSWEPTPTESLLQGADYNYIRRKNLTPTNLSKFEQAMRKNIVSKAPQNMFMQLKVARNVVERGTNQHKVIYQEL